MFKGKNYIYFLSIVSSLGGFLFGYDTAVISGTIEMVNNQFNLDLVSQGWYVSSALVGCVVGVINAGWLSDRYGRKLIMILSALLFSVSAIGCRYAMGFDDLVIYRLVGGIGVGVASMLSPMYISELAPAKSRGGLVALYQLAITVGILISYFVNASLISAQDQEVWRIMLGSESIPALLFLLLLLLIPESPRWLLAKGKTAQSQKILNKIMSQKQALGFIEEFQKQLKQSKAAFSLRQIFQTGLKKAIIIGAVLAIITQVTGINAVIYYGPSILMEAGFGTENAMSGQIIIGIVIVLSTLIAVWKIDPLGRKKLLVFGEVFMLVSLIALSLLGYYEKTDGLAFLIFILTFIAGFSFSLGPVFWVLVSEMYPTNIRGKAMSITTSFVWIFTALIGQVVPWMLENLKFTGTFLSFASMCVLALIFTILFVPETKGKSLEEIEKLWQ